MASTTIKQRCEKCDKGAAIATCNGCQRSFCIKHFGEHRREISQQMDNIGQEHDLLRRDMNYERSAYPFLARIDQWEQETIRMVQASAQKARIDLQQLLDQTKNELKIAMNRVTEELRTCQESDNYTELDIKKWTEQLRELRQMIENPSNINIGCENDATSVISLIKVSSLQRSMLYSNQERRNDTRISEQYAVLSSEKFAEIYGNITLSADGLTGYCSGNHLDGSYISGIGRYSSRIHRIRFRIENKVSNFLFFGIITASQNLTSEISKVKSAYGWWDLGFSVFSGHGKCEDYRKYINSGDEITLTLDCDNRLIQLQHHRTNTSVEIPINLEHCPFPWKIVARLDSEHDCVKIVH